MTYDTTVQLLKTRRSIYPHQYHDNILKDETLHRILQSANWAPTHKKTEPWRFIAYHSKESKVNLSNFLVEAMVSQNKGKVIPDIKLKKMRNKPIQSGAVVAIVLHKSPEDLIPEWEEIAAVSCAVQNMWLTARSLGIGAYWSSPSFVINERLFFDLADNEKCLGLFYMGRYTESFETNPRNDYLSKTSIL